MEKEKPVLPTASGLMAKPVKQMIHGSTFIEKQMLQLMFNNVDSVSYDVER